jgi:hypothetical protein
MKKYLLAFILLVGFFGIANAEKAPIKFGEISKAELLNKVYTPDTSAPAVVLCDYGYFTESRFQFVRTLRIKILKKEGYPMANQTFSIDSKASIRGITFNLEGNEIVETRLKNESIFKTRVTDDIYEMRVAMPNVKVGSIIDIQFMYIGIPSEWDFQQEIPVVRSELVIEPSMYLTFSKNFFGYIPLTFNSSNRWVSENVPAFKPEPFMTSSKNYRTRFEFDLESVSFPGYYKAYTTSWDALGKLLFSSTYFGVVLNADGYIKAEAKNIKAGAASQEDLIRMAYDHVKQIKWDETERLFTDKTGLNSSYKEGKGNSAEVNLALVQLLRKLDFNAGPVVMSTRSNGRLSAFKPSLNKLNYVIAAIFTDKDTLLLDATEANCPYYLLPMRDLNGQGRYIDKNLNGWLPLQAKKKDKQMVVYTLSVEEDMTLKGTIVYSKADYAALNFRNDYEDFNSDDAYMTDFKEGKKGLKIVSHKIDNLDSLYKPLNEEFQVVSNNSVSDIDGEFYIMPLLFEQIKENPFKVSTREYPIDFGYSREKTIIVNYTIPKGFTVANMPANVSLKLAENAAFFSCKSSVTDGRLTLIYKFNINNSIFLQTQYADLREFFNQVIAKQAEPIVLKKI